jgi:hypothetical protein
MSTRKWVVFCKEEVDVEEWVYASSKEKAMEVIKDNFYGLKPLYAVEIKPKTVEYYMGIPYEVEPKKKPIQYTANSGSCMMPEGR